MGESPATAAAEEEESPAATAAAEEEGVVETMRLGEPVEDPAGCGEVTCGESLQTLRDRHALESEDDKRAMERRVQAAHKEYEQYVQSMMVAQATDQEKSEIKMADATEAQQTAQLKSQLDKSQAEA